VGGGGRYDGLIEQLGGPSTPAIGWAAGIERIMLALGGLEEAGARDLFIAAAGEEERRRAMALAGELRRAGLSVEVDLAGRALKGQLKHADRIRARHVVILDAEGAQLRDMESGEQRPVEPDSLLDALSG
jgi:histidyl-tRNA synthetase